MSDDDDDELIKLTVGSIVGFVDRFRLSPSAVGVCAGNVLDDLSAGRVVEGLRVVASCNVTGSEELVAAGGVA